MKELSDRLAVSELAGWYALYEMDPWGELRGDIRAAVVGAAGCQAWGARIAPTDLLPKFDQGEQQHDQELGLAAWKRYVERHNKLEDSGSK